MQVRCSDQISIRQNNWGVRAAVLADGDQHCYTMATITFLSLQSESDCPLNGPGNELSVKSIHQ